MKVTLSASKFKDRFERRRYIRAKMKKQGNRKQSQIEQLIGSEIQEKEHRCLGELQDPVNSKTLRVYFQNVNTLGLGGIGETETALQILDAADASLIYIIEANTNPDHGLVQLQIKTAIRRRMKGASYEIGSNSGYRPKGIRKPGSMLAITVGKVRKYVVDSDNDRKGRWMKTRIRIGAMKLAAYSIYVPQKTDGGGSTTVRRQLQNVLDEEEVTTERNTHLYE